MATIGTLAGALALTGCAAAPAGAGRAAECTPETAETDDPSRLLQLARACSAEIDKLPRGGMSWREPPAIALYTVLCKASAKLGHFERARANCVVPAGPGGNEESFFYFLLAANRLGHHAFVVQLVNDPSKQDRVSARVEAQHGEALLALGRQEVARKVLRDALARYPDDADLLALMDEVDR